MCRFQKRKSAYTLSFVDIVEMKLVVQIIRKVEFLEVLSSFKTRTSTSSNHSSEYANNKASRIPPEGMPYLTEVAKSSHKKCRRPRICLVLCFPPKDVDLDLVSHTHDRRPLGRRRELLKDPIVIFDYTVFTEKTNKQTTITTKKTQHRKL